MKNGSYTPFFSIPALPDSGLITKTYLQGLEQAIKQRTPIAGGNITLKIADGSYVISSNDSSGVNLGYEDITLTVCSNGTPAQITVLGKLTTTTA